ncbi:DNA-3-methyladenine glycosylase I [Nitrogeniibacter mangrovi]|uniref:DNA-3-methyladenine glycosylase I n=1 Tax=Nitrogeniibacter mangrovi TaxID=2016596 RepID=A0A6C1B458_9RHOO|nr:DNA-3-methyladenine glycosylase I [Nitrogeniibacter mangrovi]QID17789.1 DNA-3-methyladenine glycosylase I [Nitrogeniibacter mangrovi]
MTDALPRCPWCGDDPAYVAYHDNEWGVPEHDDTRLFEMLILEGAQAGLSWRTILQRREGYREAFAGFDPERIARFGEAEVQALLNNPGIVRHAGKIRATIGNAQAWLALVDREGAFVPWIWQFVDGTPQINRFAHLHEVPASTEASRAMSRALKRLGFKFVGETICYAFMQATGMVNDHLLGCHRHPQYNAERL